MHPLHMPLDDFRRNAHATIDWICNYLARVESLPVRSTVAPGAVRAALPAHPPEAAESFDACLADLDRAIVPGLTHWASPNFFAYFPCNASPPAILGELLSAGLGTQGMLWQTSPACTELETLVLDWLVELLDLPRAFRSEGAGGGVIQDTASSAALCALLAARERATGFATNDAGLDQSGPGALVAYTSDQAHSSIEKAVRIAGLGTRHLRAIQSDERCAMRPDALAAALREDAAAGRRPCFVSATVGTTGANGMDPLRAIGALAREHGAWFHVDAAMSGTAALCPEFRGMHDGLETADSYCFNPHKWMLVNFDCDCFWVRDRAALVRTLSILPEYLRNAATDAGAVFDYRDWQVPLGRRFRALKLWLVLRCYGAEGLRRLVRLHVELAQALAAQVRADARFELLFEPPLNLVCLRLRAGDAATKALLDAVNDTGRAYLSHAVVGGRFVVRVSIGATWTEARHVEALWALLSDLADDAIAAAAS